MRTRRPILVAVLLATAGVLPGAPAAAAQPGTAQWQVSGTVRDETKPFRNIIVSMNGPDNLRTRTDAQGRYTFTGSVPGTYRVSMQKPDDASRARSRTVRVAAGDRVDGLDLVAPKGAVIAGQVRDRAGRPVTGVVVEAYLRTLATTGAVLSVTSGAVTNDRGAYRIAYLPPGAYVVGAAPAIRKPLKAVPANGKRPDSLPPAYPPRTYSPGDRNPLAAALVEVAPGDERTAVDIVMEKVPAYCVTFRPSPALPDVQEPFDLNATLTEWHDGRGERLANAKVTGNENWRICGVPSGTYTLRLWAYFPKRLNGLGLGLATAEVDQDHADAGRVEVLGYERLTGRVSVRGAPSEAALPDGMRLHILPANRSWEFSETFDAKIGRDGLFDLPNLFRDTPYIVEVRNLPAGYYMTRMDQGGADVRNGAVRTGAGQVEIQLADDGPRLSGRVLGDDGKSLIAEATVFLVNKDSGAVHIAQTDESGVYLFDQAVSRGEYRLVAVRDLPEGSRRDVHAADAFLSQAIDVQLAARENRTFDLTGRSRRSPQ